MTNRTGQEVINMERRNALKAGGGFGLFALFGAFGLLKSGVALAVWNKTAFSAKTMDDALSAMGASTTEINATLIQLTVPEIAENGAIVPVTVSSYAAQGRTDFHLRGQEPERDGSQLRVPRGHGKHGHHPRQDGANRKRGCAGKSGWQVLSHCERSQSDGWWLRRLMICGHISNE